MRYQCPFTNAEAWCDHDEACLVFKNESPMMDDVIGSPEADEIQEKIQ